MPYALGPSITHLIKGDAIRGILKNLALQFPRTFTLRELARATNLNINAIVHGYKKLEKTRIIINTSKTRSSAVTLNKDHPFFLPILELMHKSYGLGYSLHKLFDNMADITAIILTPAYIYRIYSTLPSDKQKQLKEMAHILFVGTPDIIELNHKIELLEQQFEMSIPVAVLRPSEVEIRLRAQDDIFLMPILSDLHVFIKGSLASILAPTSQWVGR